MKLVLLLVVITFVFTLVYWYKYRCVDQLDKLIMNPTKQLLVLSLCVIFVFILLIFIGQYILGETNNASIIVFLYGLFSQTTSAYNPSYDLSFQLFSLLVSVIGAVFFSGILVSMITNSILCRVGDYKDGKIHYKQLHKHDIIIGANEILPAIINSLKVHKTKILIVSEKSPNEIKKMLYMIDSDVVNKQLIIYNEHSLHPAIINWLCLERCNSITILGEQHINDNDSDNVIVLNSLIHYINASKTKIKFPIRCYISYYDSYNILNYCRNENLSKINIIPFNFYASCINNVWGIGQLFNKITNIGKVNTHYNYIPLFDKCIGSKQVVILGYSLCAEEIIKFILLNAHTALNKTEIVLITKETSNIEKFIFKSHISKIKNVVFIHKPISEFSVECRNLIDTYSKLPNLYIVCCGNDTNQNIALANSLPTYILRQEIPVLIKADYFMPCNAPLDEKGRPRNHFMFFGHLDQSIYETIDLELAIAQSIRYIHSQNLATKEWNITKDYREEASEEWFAKQIDLPKMNILSRVTFINTIFDLMGIEICQKNDAMDYEKVLPLKKFLPLFYSQQCAFYILAGYTAAVETNYRTKEVRFIKSYSTVEQDKNIIESYIRFYNDIKIWLDVNDLGCRVRTNSD